MKKTKTRDEYGRLYLKPRIGYAIVETKRRGGSGLTLHDVRMPIFWYQSAANRWLREFYGENLETQPIVIKVTVETVDSL